jgi:hypothetical protein
MKAGLIALTAGTAVASVHHNRRNMPVGTGAPSLPSYFDYGCCGTVVTETVYGSSTFVPKSGLHMLKNMSISTP